MARTFLHIGVPKTGTTFLQAVLWRQRELALDQGVLLPLTGVADHHHACLDLLGRPDRSETPDRVPGSWSRLVAAAGASTGDALVSHELFALASDEQAARAVADLAAGGREVHVVVTVRDLGRQLPSLWQETVKAARTWTLAEFVDELRGTASDAGQDLDRLQDYAALVARWSRTVAPERVHVVTVPPASADRSLLWRRFCSVVGLEPEAFSLDVPHANDSLGAEQVELLRRVNLQLAGRMSWPAPYVGVVKRSFARRVLAARPGGRIPLPPAALPWVRERTEELIALLAASGVHVVGDLDELLVAEGVTADDRAADETPLADEAVAALAELLLDVAETRQRHRATVARLRGRLADHDAPGRERGAARLLRRLLPADGGRR